VDSPRSAVKIAIAAKREEITVRENFRYLVLFFLALTVGAIFNLGLHATFKHIPELVSTPLAFAVVVICMNGLTKPFFEKTGRSN
jgi:Na+/glutamate symporter